MYEECSAILGWNHLLSNGFLKKSDWVISKLNLLSPNQNAYIWEITFYKCFLRNQLTDDSALISF